MNDKTAGLPHLIAVQRMSEVVMLKVHHLMRRACAIIWLGGKNAISPEYYHNLYLF